MLICPTIASGVAKQDAWLSAVFASLFGVLVIWIYWFLGSRYPSETLIGVVKRIFGKWLGTIVATGYVVQFLSLTFALPWFVGDFTTSEATTQTPAYVIVLFYAIAIVIAILYGLETIARATELLAVFALGLFCIAMLLVSPNIKFENMLPTLENGIAPVLKGAVLLSFFMTFPAISTNMIYPKNIKDVHGAKKSFFYGYFLDSVMVFISIFMCILVLGSNITAFSQYPTYFLAKEINLGSIVSRLEYMIAAVWIVTEFMIALLSFYACIIGISQLLGLKDHKRLVLPLGILVLLISPDYFPNEVYQVGWVITVWGPFTILFDFMIPVLMVFVYLIKNTSMKNRGKNS